MSRIHATWNSKMQFAIEDAAGRAVVVDTDEPHGGEDSGMRPKELILMGLAGCTGMDVISVLTKKRQPVEKFEIMVTGHVRDESPKYYDHVVVEYVVTGDVERAALDRAIELSITKYCAVYATMKHVAKMETKSRIVRS